MDVLYVNKHVSVGEWKQEEGNRVRLYFSLMHLKILEMYVRLKKRVCVWAQEAQKHLRIYTRTRLRAVKKKDVTV